MNSITLKRKGIKPGTTGVPWEFKYENNPHGAGYYYLSTYKTGNHVLYRIEFNWQFECNKGHLPDIQVSKLGEDKKTWLECTKMVGAVSINFGRGCFTFK